MPGKTKTRRLARVPARRLLLVLVRRLPGQLPVLSSCRALRQLLVLEYRERLVAVHLSLGQRRQERQAQRQTLVLRLRL